jgi:hypothetical protein
MQGVFSKYVDPIKGMNTTAIVHDSVIDVEPITGISKLY